jgi:hypothetical protein
MGAKKIVLIGGGGLAAYMLYRWWQRRQAAPAAASVANGVAPAVPTPAVAPAVPSAPAAPNGITMPTAEQAANPSYWEGLAREIAASIQGLGALPPWPGIGPVPSPMIGYPWWAGPMMS